VDTDLSMHEEEVVLEPVTAACKTSVISATTSLGVEWTVVVADRSDVKNVIKDQLDVRPFVLVSSDHRAGGDHWVVEVTDVLSAECLRESLSVTHDHYRPSTGNILSRGIDRLFGEVTKGYQVVLWPYISVHV